MLSRFVQSRIARARQEFARLRRAEDGVAAVEFGLIVPIIMLLFIGAVEISQAISVDRRVSQASGSVADLVARAQGTIPFTTMAAIVKGGSYVLRTYPETPLKFTIKNVTASTTSPFPTKITWQCTYDGSQAPGANNDNYPLPVCACSAAVIVLPKPGLVGPGGSVVVADTTYEYQPIIFDFFLKRNLTQNGNGTYTFTESSYLTPRSNAASLMLADNVTVCPP